MLNFRTKTSKKDVSLHTACHLAKASSRLPGATCHLANGAAQLSGLQGGVVLERFGLILHWFKGHNLVGRKKTKR